MSTVCPWDGRTPENFRCKANFFFLVGSLIRLGHRLGLEVVAEGVETDARLRALASDGCDLVQGYLVGRPAPDLPAVGGGGTG